MLHLETRSLWLLPTLAACACAGTANAPPAEPDPSPPGEETCILPDFASNAWHFLMDYELREEPNEEYQGGELSAQSVRIGGGEGKAGNPTTTAVQTFDCGDEGTTCKIQVTTGSRGSGDGSGNFLDGEQVEITFRWGNESKLETFDHTMRYPIVVDVPTCQGVTVEIRMTEGSTPGLQTRTETVLKTWCADC